MRGKRTRNNRGGREGVRRMRGEEVERRVEGGNEEEEDGCEGRVGRGRKR